MATIKIQIVRTDLEEYGCEQEPTYRPLKFKDSELIGYWSSDESNLMTIYIGRHEFICKWNKMNVDLLDNILDNDKMQKG